MGRDGKWRRQYPIPFRVLEDPQRFKRWEWIKYEYTATNNDDRRESQKVVPESIQVASTMPVSERAKLLNPLIRGSSRDAQARGESLALVRPKEIELTWREKSATEIADEARKHAELVSQASMFQQQAKPLTPCPYEFRLRWIDRDGMQHRNVCDDWETSAAWFNRRKELTSDGALNFLKEKYEGLYMERGMVLAIGTHSRRDQQWLLVGLIRLDESLQRDLLFG